MDRQTQALFSHRKKQRTLVFVLQVAARQLYPDYAFRMRYDLPRGYYCELCHPSADARSGEVKLMRMSDILALKQRMKELRDRALPILSELIPKADAIAIFRSQHQPEKAELIASLRADRCQVYQLCGVTDTLHGQMLDNTSEIGHFDLNAFGDGFCLRYESPESGGLLPNLSQGKIASELKHHFQWCQHLGVTGAGALNRMLQEEGGAIGLINLCEARHEAMYASVAAQIYACRDDVRVVFIAGPSSSGKTSTSLRLAQQCRVAGLNPKVIELDNYFVDREQTPRDENGDYDFESLQAMRIDLLNDQLSALFAGEEVVVPRFDFARGKGFPGGSKLRLEEDDILIMEGIHALNPEMVPGIDASKIFRVYASALTSLNLDENVTFSTSDNRFLRRIIRDNRVRSTSPEETILRWYSVRRGENKNIFPFQENADAFINTALIYELPLLKYYAEPLLRKIDKHSPAWFEAGRLLSFLSYLVALSPTDIAAIPPTSIIREFIGGQTLVRP